MASETRSFLRLVDEDALGATLAPSVAAAFPEPYTAPWLRACRRLGSAGYGSTVVKAYTAAAPRCARLVGPEPAIAMADTVSRLAIKSGRRAAEMLSEASEGVAARLAEPAAFSQWLAIMEQLAADAPESVPGALRHTNALLASLSLGGLKAWIVAGLRLSGGDKDCRRAFFEMEDPEAERWLRREAGELVFADAERRMKAYLCALFGVRVPIREPSANAPEAARRRPSFGEGLIRMPPTFPGYRGERVELIFRAALAHVGAHFRFTGGRFAVGELKPIQIALVSLIEDARVERLAVAELPGLGPLWRAFHVAKPSGPLTAPNLFARLSRALIDPAFEDDNPFVMKGRALFEAAAPRLRDPAIAREIGNVLGNDLGQMRVQFNPKTYVTEPAYRDDNLGLWDVGKDRDLEEEDAEIIYESVRIMRQREEDPAEPERRREEESDAADADVRRARAGTVAQEEGVPVARYGEYDYVTERERAEWTTVREYQPAAGSLERARRILERNEVFVERLSNLIRTAKVSRPRRQRRQIEGDALDMDAVIETVIARRSGERPDPRVYQTMARQTRDLSVLVLLDISQSTAERVKGHIVSVLDLEREATLLLAHAMAQSGDPFALAAFSSNQRDDVRYVRIKDFDEPYGPTAMAALAGLKAGYSTRLGAALRHAAGDLERAQTYRRLVLVVSDGEPSDIDCPDPRYLVEDTRRAVQTLAVKGIDVFCVGLDSASASTLHRIFGRRNVVHLDRIERLPERLPMLYLSLAH